MDVFVIGDCPGQPARSLATRRLTWSIADHGCKVRVILRLEQTVMDRAERSS